MKVSPKIDFKRNGTAGKSGRSYADVTLLVAATMAIELHALTTRMAME